jgi:murein DD-endopeptidase MepM/ murein hydrolase activator NlpD
VYALPYAPGSKRRVIQGYRGNYSHEQGSPNEYAIDWSMPAGTAIRAARGGIVVGVRQDATTGGPSRDFLNCVNYVILRHADGTYGEYLHLQPNGAQVKLGDEVATGQVIARSGNTGFSSGPHLHFAVFRTIDGNARETLPVQFRLADGSAGTLEQGRDY